MARFAVTLSYQFTTEVEADDEDEAMDLAEEEAAGDVCSIDDLNLVERQADGLESDDEDEDEEETEDDDSDEDSDEELDEESAEG